MCQLSTLPHFRWHTSLHFRSTPVFARFCSRKAHGMAPRRMAWWTDELIDQLSDKPIIRSTDQPTNQPTNQLTNPPTNQPTNRSTNQPTIRSTDQPISISPTLHSLVSGFMPPGSIKKNIYKMIQFYDIWNNIPHNAQTKIKGTEPSEPSLTCLYAHHIKQNLKNP